MSYGAGYLIYHTGNFPTLMSAIDKDGGHQYKCTISIKKTTSL